MPKCSDLEKADDYELILNYTLIIRHCNGSIERTAQLNSSYQNTETPYAGDIACVQWNKHMHLLFVMVASIPSEIFSKDSGASGDLAPKLERKSERLR